MKRYTVAVGDSRYVIDIEALGAPDSYRVWVDGRPYEVRLSAEANGQPALSATPVAEEATAPTPSAAAPPAPDHSEELVAATSPVLRAPMPGVILQVSVQPGAAVQRGDPLLVLEAMKMKNVIRSPRAGVVAQVLVQPGQNVQYDAPLLRFEGD